MAQTATATLRIGEGEARNRAVAWDAYARTSGDGRALCALIEAYLPLVVREVRCAGARVGKGVDPRDLIGPGVIGLHDAVRRYRPSRQVPFERYARVCIRGAIAEELRRADPLTRRQRASVKQLAELAEELSRQRGRPATTAELARAAGLTEDAVCRLQSLGAAAASLDEADEGGLCALDRLADESTPSPCDQVDLALCREALRSAIQRLDEREQQVVFFHHHLGLTMHEIAEIFGVSVGRISQLHSAVIVKLRGLMHIQPPAGASA